MSRRCQTTAHDAHRELSLAGSIPSPYAKELNGIGPARDTRLPLTYMLGIINSFNGAVGSYAQATIIDAGAIVVASVVAVDLTGVTDRASYKTALKNALDGFASGSSLTITVYVVDGATFPDGLTGAPKAAIADAATNAPTNLNVLTTLLGTLTGEVNATNAKQNDLATKFNTLKAELAALGLIST